MHIYHKVAIGHLMQAWVRFALHCFSFSICLLLLRFNLASIQESQETALMMAARKGSVGIVKTLIQHGANVNLTNKVTCLSGPCSFVFILQFCVMQYGKHKHRNGNGNGKSNTSILLCFIGEVLINTGLKLVY